MNTAAIQSAAWGLFSTCEDLKAETDSLRRAAERCDWTILAERAATCRRLIPMAEGALDALEAALRIQPPKEAK